MKIESKDKTDVIIIGAGIVGLTCACALANTSLKVTVIDACTQRPVFSEGEYDMRVSAITRASQTIFHNLGAWELMRGLRVSPYREMYVWDDNGSIHFDSAYVGESELGYIVENTVIQQVLRQQVERANNIDLIYGCILHSIDVSKHGVTLQTDDNHILQSRLVIGADGVHSWLRQQCGVEQRQWSYQQTAIIATINTEKPHQLTAWQRFMPDGPLALLPLADSHDCSIVWSAATARANELLSLSDTQFADAVANACEHRLGEINIVSSRQSFPLTMRHSKQYVLPNIAFIGDAAHSLHPLAGQGANLGILDAACLAQTLQQAHRKGRDIASLATLQRYARWRRGHNWEMILAMEGFKRLFSNDVPWIKRLRNRGLTMTNRLPLVKQAIIRRAMGLQGDLPVLARVQ